MYKPKSGCPDGWSEGSVRHTLLPNSRIAPSLDSTLVEDGVISNYCAHEGTDADRHCSESNTAKWSRGSYCIAEGTIKEGGIIDKSCPEGFEYSWFVIDDVTTNNRNEVNGSVPEGQYHGRLLYECIIRILQETWQTLKPDKMVFSSGAQFRPTRLKPRAT